MARTATLPDGRTYTPSVGNHPKSLDPTPAAKIATRVILIVVALYFLFPIYWLIVSSTKDNADLLTASGLWFADNSIAQNYAGLMSWSRNEYWTWVANSIIYSTAAGVIGTLISVSAGYGLAKFKFPGRNAVQLSVLAGLLLPIALLTVPLYLVFHGLGLTNTMAAIIIPSCVSPFGVFLGRLYAETSVPDELIEAARIDGAGEFRIFFTMVLRLLAPAMVTIFLFIFVATWNNFLLPLMMITENKLKPVTLGMYGMMAQNNTPDYGSVLMGSLFGVLPLVVIFLVLQRFWQSGLAAGAVKG
ncbi:carbohydrate ABC transporter permease [Bowdeniella massiliensis]|uniref:carbohydrate ABC transporter permease n=1 Tax=Bowdeniella massiliensis TaxID=2932264 RepID=UPI00202858D2|nr:carbohydrate ABC transporter permease [Bowdeniella massiliensis]